VKTLQFSAALAATVVLTSLLAADALAQVPVQPQAQSPVPVHPVARPAGAGNIALLDVNYIFEKHVRFKGMMDDMKQDVERAENDVKTEKDAIKKLMDNLERFKNTVDYKRMEEEIAKRQSDLQVKVALQRKEFLQREANIYRVIYQEVWEEVQYYCAANGVDVVLRFNGDRVDPEKPDSVLAYINRPVVWYAENRDITPIILNRLNERYKAPAARGPADTTHHDMVPFNTPRPR
jgi:Skp family chaperone for outer membrane proteins